MTSMNFFFLFLFTEKKVENKSRNEANQSADKKNVANERKKKTKATIRQFNSTLEEEKEKQK